MMTILDIPGSNPPNWFLAPIKTCIESSDYSSLVNEAAKDLVDKVTASSDPAEALWQLWDAFFNTVVYTSTSHTPHLLLLETIRAQPPEKPDNTTGKSDAKLRLRFYTEEDGQLHWSELPLFSAQWRDIHDILQQWRGWDGVRDARVGDESTASKLEYTGSELYSRFCVFSLELLKGTTGRPPPVQTIWVFYLCHEVLERKGPESGQKKPHRMTSEQLWAFDMRIAAMWLREGGRALWETDRDELRKHWAAALDWKTELWASGDGLTRERWQLWEERLRGFSKDKEMLDAETRIMAGEAAEVIKALLNED